MASRRPSFASPTATASPVVLALALAAVPGAAAEDPPDTITLSDGETYPIDFFFAERHRTQSNFRIETTLEMENEGLSTVSVICD
jgi:hypothetical protein